MKNPILHCPSCGLLDDWKKNPLKPYCSVVCLLLWRYGLAWRTQPYRIVVASHPHLDVQNGPRFDLREQVLKGARERALAAERKRRQRTARRLQDVPPTEQFKRSIQGSFSISEAENIEGGSFYGT